MAVKTGAVETAGEGGDPRQAESRQPRRPRRVTRTQTSPLVLGVLIVLLGITAALAVASHVIYARNEDRLLKLRGKELELVLTAAVSATETPVVSASAFANATDGNPAKFRAFAKQYVGPQNQFASMSLWSAHSSAATPAAVQGPAPVIESQPARVRAMLRAAFAKNQLVVVNELNSGGRPSIGYAIASGGYVVYVQRDLLANRHSRLEANSAFADLTYAFYLGRQIRSSNLLVTDAATLPLRGRTARELTPFGDTQLTLVITPRGSLGGSFFERLPWVIAGFGLLIALAAALLTDRLVRGRLSAERLARSLDQSVAENQRLYAEQRGIAQELQHALLPEALPSFDGLEASVRYLPGTLGLDVGGDWYDVVSVGPETLMLVVGDVSGRGLRAATTMASLRNTTVAYAAEGDGPGDVLAKLDRLVRSSPHDYFATVLCARIEIDSHRVTVASAGHLAPLVLDDAGARFLEFKTGAPVGAVEGTTFEETTVTVGRGATLIVYTDGLVERRGEVLDAGLERLRDAAVAGSAGTIDQLVSSLVDDLLETDSSDDTAIVAVRWRD